MSYIMITTQKNQTRVSWNTSKRVEGKKYPIKESVHLGELTDDNKELLLSPDLKLTITEEIINKLKEKNINFYGNYNNGRGRQAIYLTKTKVEDVENMKDEVVGTYRLLHGLAQEHGFIDALNHAFGKDSESIFALMCQRLDDKMNSYLAKDWGEETEFEVTTLSLSPKSVSNLLKRIEPYRLVFAKKWFENCGSPKNVIEDSTHFCTRASESSLREMEEFGWDHHKEEGLRQFNLMSLIATDLNLPIMYRAYNGSITDISTLTDTSAEMDIIGSDTKLNYITDCGYFSEFNLRYIINRGEGFLMEAKWQNETERLLTEYRAKLTEPGEFIQHGKYVYRWEKCIFNLYKTENNKTVKDIALDAFILYSELEKSERTNSLYSQLNIIINNFGKYDFRDKEHAQEWLDTSCSGFGKFFSLEQEENKEPVIKINRQKVEELVSHYGVHTLVMHGFNIDVATAMKMNHGRDPIEKLWKTMKGTLNSNTLCTKLDETTLGKIFIVWGAAVLHSMVNNLLKKNNKNKLTVDEFLKNIRKIKIAKIGKHNIHRRPPAKAIDAVVDNELERFFLEFKKHFKAKIDIREERKKKELSANNQGRPPRFPLKKQ